MVDLCLSLSSLQLEGDNSHTVRFTHSKYTVQVLSIFTDNGQLSPIRFRTLHHPQRNPCPLAATPFAPHSLPALSKHASVFFLYGFAYLDILCEWNPRIYVDLSLTLLEVSKILC